ncbi:NAD(P)/FAD-dependent oxidoreductase [Amnibacterium setariae]|uniref:NAD(P)/FAD-dependent oxidoreductase n=1 Tax=Amnibacterium setariae TaxID=2306585 RepID=A0A3A1U4L6_9MICO|nr:NAD(P)/FAD-dependent oxidoreductase [Amnibacterium setariae]
MDETAARSATVVVIGAGQAGLSTAYHLQRNGFVSALDEPTAGRTFVVLDAERAAGGAWQHRWPSLVMSTVNGIFDLPGMHQDPPDPLEPSRDAVPRYFARYEQVFALPILRPVRVRTVHRVDDRPDGALDVETDAGRWRARVVLNATGTWGAPRLPRYPGAERFRGRQLHTRDYRSADEFAGLRVGVVGGGISAVQLLDELSRVATTSWYTRREPVILDGEFDRETVGRATIARVAADAEAGRPMGSVVSYTGLFRTEAVRAAEERGVLRRRPMFTAMEPDGVREADGSFTPLDAVLWATGFAADIDHLAPLGLRGPLGGIPTAGTRVVADPRIHLVGIGPSQSTIGANRAGRDAVRDVLRLLDRTPASTTA